MSRYQVGRVALVHVALAVLIAGAGTTGSETIPQKDRSDFLLPSSVIGAAGSPGQSTNFELVRHQAQQQLTLRPVATAESDFTSSKRLKSVIAFSW